MPDIFTHLMVGVSIALLVRKDDNRIEQMMIVLGSVLIDIERPIAWVLARTDFDWIGITMAFHSILGAMVLSHFTAACFVMEETSFKNRFMLILLGCTSHLVLDLIMYPWIEMGIHLLYPLKLVFSFNLFWPDFWWYPLFGMIALLSSVCIRLLWFLIQKKGVNEIPTHTKN